MTITPHILAPYDAHTVDGTTLAEIEILAHPTDTHGTVIPAIKSFSYSSDVQTLGDPFSLSIPDPRGKWRGIVIPGATVLLSLSSPLVDGGAKTPKMKGVIVDTDVSVSTGGTVISVTGADLGWHLQDNSGPLHYQLRGQTFDKLLSTVLDPSWGFGKTQPGNDTSRRLKQGRQGEVIAATPEVLTPIILIQIEPGEKIADVLILYARREGLLVNMSPLGNLQFFSPNYSQPAKYKIEFHQSDDAESVRNNVLDLGARRKRTIKGVFTEVTCVGDIVNPDVVDQLERVNANSYKFRGDYSSPNAAPFRRRDTFSDGEQLTKVQATMRAFWKAKFGLFNADVVTYPVRGHAQGGVFWESDTMVSVNDTVLGINGPMYCSAVRCDRDEGGDVTWVTLHRPDLLSAT